MQSLVGMQILHPSVYPGKLGQHACLEPIGNSQPALPFGAKAPYCGRPRNEGKSWRFTTTLYNLFRTPPKEILSEPEKAIQFRILDRWSRM